MKDVIMRHSTYQVVTAKQLFMISFGMFFFCVASMNTATAQSNNLLDLDLEALMDVEVYSVSRKAQKLVEAPSAVFAMNSEDIRRSGATTVPELLRMVPGIEVARISANRWSVTARGFNGAFANKLLVLVDGRTVYSPLFSGVYWQEQELFLQDIERIEVIRGPGATLWGANAVNGVINITTKSSNDTHGTLVYGGGGTEERANGGARYGGKLGEKGSIRLHAKYYNRDSSESVAGGDAFDQYDGFTTGVRTDFSPSPDTELTLQGDYYSGEQENEQFLATLTPPFGEDVRSDEDYSGYNAVSRVTHRISETSEITAQLYYDRSERDIELGKFSVDTIDFDLQHRFALLEHHELTWGANVRYITDDANVRGATAGVPFVEFLPHDRSYSLAGAFLHDEISLIENELNFIVGSKFSHNDFSGFEVQPNARLIWTPSEKHSIWTAYSRAVRTPARINDDLAAFFGLVPLPDGSVGQQFVLGNREVESENLNAYELGYRIEPSRELFFDLATFYFDYDDVIAVETLGTVFNPATMPPTVTLPLDFENNQEAQSWGVEFLADYRPYSWWRIQAAYSFVTIDVRNLSPGTLTAPESIENGNSQNRASLRSLINIGERWELDSFLRYVDNMSFINASAYLELDVRVGYRIGEGLSLSIIGQNLLQDAHEEFGSTPFAPNATELQRGVYGVITWNFDSVAE
jgi:iron complex outermembrane receptor protein